MVNFFRKKNIIILLLLIILILAAFFRLWQLDKIPPGLYPDEAINGNDALDTLENCDKFKIFYPENNGREGLFIWLLSFSFAVFGPNIWAIRIVPAIFGVLTVLGLYLLTKELFQNFSESRARRIALLASFFLAISFWHINFSRIGFRAILVPFFLVFGFYLLNKGFRQKSAQTLIFSGIFLGLGFYTYISYRFVIFPGIATLICWWFIYKQKKLRKEFLKLTACCLLSTIIVALPIGIYFLQNPQDFFGRATGVSVFSQKNPVFQLGKSIILHLGMFNFYGDYNWRHNFAGSPMLLWPIGIFFLIGLIYSLYICVKSILLRSSILLHFFPSGFLVSWWAIMLLPGILTYEGIPHALRTVGVIPAVYALAAIGAFWLFEKLKIFYKTKKQSIALYLLILIFLSTLCYVSFNKYFFQWGKAPETEGAFSKNYVEIGKYLNSLSPDIQKYVIVNQSGVPVPWPDGIPMPAQTPMFIERTKFGNIRSNYLLPEDLEQVKIIKKTVIVPMGYDENLFTKIYMMFPWGNFQEKKGFWVYKIE